MNVCFLLHLKFIVYRKIILRCIIKFCTGSYKSHPILLSLYFQTVGIFSSYYSSTTIPLDFTASDKPQNWHCTVWHRQRSDTSEMLFYLFYKLQREMWCAKAQWEWTVKLRFGFYPNNEHCLIVSLLWCCVMSLWYHTSLQSFSQGVLLLGCTNTDFKRKICGKHWLDGDLTLVRSSDSSTMYNNGVPRG